MPFSSTPKAPNCIYQKVKSDISFFFVDALLADFVTNKKEPWKLDCQTYIVIKSEKLRTDVIIFPKKKEERRKMGYHIVAKQISNHKGV